MRLLPPDRRAVDLPASLRPEPRQPDRAREAARRLLSDRAGQARRGDRAARPARHLPAASPTGPPLDPRGDRARRAQPGRRRAADRPARSRGMTTIDRFADIAAGATELSVRLKKGDLIV